MMTVTAVTLDETQAAEAEGLQMIDTRSNELRQRWLALNEQKKLIEAQQAALRDELGATLVEKGLQGLTVDGKVVVRLSNVVTQGLDVAALKANHPKLYTVLMRRYLRVTRSERMTIK